MRVMRRNLLIGGAAAALLVTGVVPALASTAGRSNAKGAGSVSSILQTGDIVTGVRGTTNGNVILTGSATGSGAQTLPFLYRGRLTSAAAGAAVSELTPSFPGVTSATFYGPDTHFFNTTIPSGQVRAVGTYQSSSAPAGVINQGMIYLGPVSGSGGSWTSMDVPAHGADTAGHVRAMPGWLRHRDRKYRLPEPGHGALRPHRYHCPPYLSRHHLGPVGTTSRRDRAVRHAALSPRRA